MTNELDVWHKIHGNVMIAVETIKMDVTINPRTSIDYNIRHMITTPINQKIQQVRHIVFQALNNNNETRII